MVECTSPTSKAFEEVQKHKQNQILFWLETTEKFIRDLKHALIKFENKTYGVCGDW